MKNPEALRAPGWIEWFWGQHPLVVGLLTLFFVWVVMFAWGNYANHEFQFSLYGFSQWHAFNWGDGVCIPLLFTLMSVACRHWEGSDRFYVSSTWYWAWMAVGIVTTVLNAFNDRRNATSWEEVFSHRWAVYHIVIIAVFVTLGGSVSGVVLAAHAPAWVHTGIELSLAGYVVSVLLDAQRKADILSSGQLLSNHY